MAQLLFRPFCAHNSDLEVTERVISSPVSCPGYRRKDCLPKAMGRFHVDIESDGHLTTVIQLDF